MKFLNNLSYIDKETSSPLSIRGGGTINRMLRESKDISAHYGTDFDMIRSLAAERQYSIVATLERGWLVRKWYNYDNWLWN